MKDETGQFFNVLVDLEYNKIRGIFTQKEAELAISEYISDNARDTVNLLLNRKDKIGQTIFKSYADAYAYLERDMMSNFFDFKKPADEPEKKG